MPESKSLQLVPKAEKAVTEKATWEHQDLAKVKVLAFHGHSKGINSCSFLNNEQHIISGSDDHSVRIWDRDRGTQVAVLTGHKGIVTCCRAAPTSSRVASTSWDKKLILWDTTTGKPLWQRIHDGIVISCDFSFDGKFLVTGSDLDHSIRIFDTHSGTLVKKLMYHNSTVTCCRFSAMNYRFCTTSMDLSTHVIDMQNYRDDIQPHRVLTVRGHTNMVSCAGFSGDDRRLCTGSWDKSLQLWDVNAGTYRNDGPVILKTDHDGCISSIKLSQDGGLLVASSYDETISIWDADNGFKKFALQGHTGWVTDCDVTNDTKMVVSASKDKTIRLWNIERSEEIPMVLQNKKSIGLRILQCDKCGKSFSIAQAQNPESNKVCVFCRLKDPFRTYSGSLFEELNS